MGSQAAALPWGNVVTALATLLAVGLTLFFTNRREARRLEHERTMKLREERQRVYMTMTRITKNMKTDDPEEVADLAEVHSEIEILTENLRVLEAAGELLHATSMARQVTAQKERSEDQYTQRRHQQAKAHLEQTRNTFIDLAREELGLGPKPVQGSGPSK